MNRRRRNTVDRGDSQVAVGIGAAAGVVAVATSAASPTGGPAGDALVLIGWAALVCWAAASAPWWAVGAAGAATAALTGGWWALAGVAAVLVAGWLGAQRSGDARLRAAGAAGVLLSSLHLTVNPFFGGSAAIAAIIVGGLAAAGLTRRPRYVRRRVALGCAGAVVAGLVFSAGFGVAAATARSDLRTGYDDLQRGLELVRDGDTTAAADALEQAAEQLRRADDSIAAPWGQPARLVPVMGQHRAAATTLVADAATTAEAAAAALRLVDLDALQIVNGRIDVDELTLLRQPLRDLADAVDGLRSSIDDADNGWLVAPAQRLLARAGDDADQAWRQVSATADLADLGPDLLGADGERRYLLAFTSPAEARGHTGLMGNWAVITITDGTIRLAESGRAFQLDDAFDAQPQSLAMPADYLSRYGRYGAGSATRPATGKYWSNITMTPDGPSVGAAMAQMYAATGNTVDGVFVIDPIALAALLDLTGGLEVDGWPTTIDADNVVSILLRDQYQLAEQPRELFLATLIDTTIDTVLGTTLPAPQQLAAAFGPVATEGHLTAWSSNPAAQDLFHRIGMAADMPEPRGDDGLAVVVNNAAGNKIDSFLRQSITYTATVDDDGVVTSTALIVLSNDAPASGLDDYVIGNIVGAPRGTNRALVSVYSPLTATAASLDGAGIGVRSETELGWNVYTTTVDIAPGGSVELTLDFRGTVEGEYGFVYRPQPLAITPLLSLNVTGPDGVVVSVSGAPEPRRRLFTRTDAVPTEQR